VAKFQTSKVTARLDAVYTKETNRLEPHLARAQGGALKRAEW
jgi:hypothetical protein